MGRIKLDSVWLTSLWIYIMELNGAEESVVSTLMTLWKLFSMIFFKTENFHSEEYLLDNFTVCLV